MKIDSNFFEQRWVKAISAEFGAQGVLAVIRLFVDIYDSPQGYWRQMSTMDRAVLAGEVGTDIATIDAILDRLVRYHVIDGPKLEKEGVVTSAEIQRGYVRQAGVAKARRLTWREHCMLTTEQLLGLGISPAIYGRDMAEDYGVPLPVFPKAPYMYAGYRLIRLRHPDPLTHIYRVIRT
ncbi:MAG: DUF4373 domain-containing protein [Muribaculaceae bacterium]|nr:DUF4373 domain-containing protein [Muribaculaceae bacterium]MDE6118347.1 DUF4373 domain-containing protein [Muribaculaceae bacterium]MDE6315505.1 DUF4373 domain-containing protein [Muribaculaceae bacterium]